MYWDENIDPYDTRYAVRREYSAFRAPVPSPTMPNVFDRPMTFRPLDRGHGRMSRGSSCSHESRPKSRGSSRVASRALSANFEWIGEFMKKFGDNASSREKRLVEETWQREKDLRGMAVERDREIRADMKQLAASEARVAALEQQLHDQAQLKNLRGDILSHGEKAYFPSLSTKSRVRPWCPSPVMNDSYVASVPTNADLIRITLLFRHHCLMKLCMRL